MEPLLEITDTNQSFHVNHNEAIMIELKLNVSEYGHKWLKLGDALFNFGSKKDSNTVLTVTTDQYQYLHMLYVC
jgi:hypothetical protein